ncbi:MAG: alpha-galactosidase [Candidatus Latescibacteria bacterium]|nr:alpha-galactosidase [Candidatus Latescibacterota bacterium]
MPRIAIIGAGSGFTRPLSTDILLIPELASGSFVLVDIDAKRLELAHQFVEKVIELTGKNWSVEASTDRRKVLAGSDYVINTIEVSGLQTVQADNDIPLKYGVKQCIGDTIGPGGLFKGLRTIPAWVEILHDIERLSPNALVMNYTNPMSMMTLAGAKSSDVEIVGLCHSVQGTSKLLAEYLDVPYEDLKWRCGGINHMSWFTELSVQGEDMYPRLRDRCKTPGIYERDPVRFEIMRHFGVFPTESSGHFSEYIPYFRKREDLIEKYCREGYRGETSFYANNWPRWRRETDERLRKYLSGEEAISLERSHEYASVIIEASEKNKPAVIYGSVLNKGLIENLPSDGVVEVACMIDRNGVNPCRFGALPPQLAALNRSNMAVYELGVKAALEHDRQAALHALQLDPLTAAVCSLDEIKQMFDELFEAEREYLPEF